MKKLILAVALVVASAAHVSQQLHVPLVANQTRQEIHHEDRHDRRCPDRRLCRAGPGPGLLPELQPESLIANPNPIGGSLMKTIMIAVALIFASAAPVLAQDFAQSYSQNR